MTSVRTPTLFVLAAVLIALLPALPVRAAGAGDPSLHRAGLIVRHGDGALTYAVVAFPEDTISGVDLLRRSGIAFLSVPFGGLGEGVCQIEREGCDATTCRRTVCQATRSSPYWQYLDQTADHGWQPAPLGASGSKVSDGDVLAWAWAADVPALPSIDLIGIGREVGLDSTAIADLGHDDGAFAAVRSGVIDTSDPLDPATLLGGVAAVVVVAAVGGGLLIDRRRRIARL